LTTAEKRTIIKAVKKRIGNLIGEKEVTYMTEKQNDILDRLINGEKVECPLCHKGYFVPYNTTADKAHYFTCSNEKCDGHFHWDSVIDIE
jgi:hypothetical protein